MFSVIFVNFLVGLNKEQIVLLSFPSIVRLLLKLIKIPPKKPTFLGRARPPVIRSVQWLNLAATEVEALFSSAKFNTKF